MTPTTALVTGATSGIGAAFARALPAATDLLLVARTPERLAAMQTGLAHPGRRIETVAADLAHDEGRDAVIMKATEMEIDLLINNAGVGRFGRVLDNEPEAERAMVELNVVAPTVLTRALLPGMIARARRDHGRCGVILLSSTTAFQPVPYLATYSATKSFLLAYGEALGAELRGSPADLLVVCPGATRTEFGRRAGFDLDNLPLAADPDRVARQSLDALGRRRVHVTDITARAALAPFLTARRAAAGGLGAVVGLLSRGTRRSGRTDSDAGAV
jgi:uncharacterized protein